MAELYFTVKTGLKDIIGKDLITDDNIAVFELVKNSYDAHANHVTITFEGNKIIIADNGKGMSFEDIQNKWLAVAYSAKKDGTEDDDEGKRTSYRDNIKSRKYYAGAKGIGRFSCDRLGGELVLTTKKGDLPAEQITIDWSRFEKDQKEDFERVEVEHTTIEKPVSFPSNSLSGTILEINKASHWDRSKIVRLKHSLEKLINPFSDSIDFNIEIICKKELDADEKAPIERDKVNGIINNSITDILALKTTQIEMHVLDSIVETKIFDRGVLIYHIEENNNFNPHINDLNVNLYFLNRAAKHNFTQRMGVQPVNYGSIFLFKNGFRVQPYGNPGDDSWGLDYRHQQGYNRYLGSRDLFGRVNITTDNTEQFKEVSSRDGGMVNTMGFNQLIDLFTTAHRRLERYVVGVLWGEAFRRSKYFKTDDEAVKFREILLDADRDADSYDAATSNIGSKIDFINLIKSLSDDKDVRIIDYNKDLINILNDNLEVVQPKFINDLEKIAVATGDSNLLQTIVLTEETFRRIEQEREEAIQRANEEERLRIEAEEKARKAEEAQRLAEQREREEKERRIQAELERERKEKERAQEELRRIKAEQRAEEEKRRSADLSDKLSIESQKNEYLNSTRKTLSDDAEQLVHSIDLYVGNASTYINELLIDKTISEKQRLQMYSIKTNIDQALKVSQMIIKSGFDYKHINQRVNIPKYIKEYLDDIAIARRNIKISITNYQDKYALVNPIDLDIIIDNLVSNSIKAKAKQICAEFQIKDNKMHLVFSDDGIGMPSKFVNNPNSIFELGVRESSERGSGIGMYDVMQRVKNLKGKISFIGNGIKLKGASFEIII